MVTNPYEIVRDFERAVAEYAGSPYAVAVDTCTMALFLCCKYLQVETVSLPKRTYCSVPCSVIHAGGIVRFDDRVWRGTYQLHPYPIIDGACRFRRGMYVPQTYHCLSFQYRKHLAIGRGGMILTDDASAAAWFRLARFSGRHEIPLTEDVPAMVGWSCYMEPERAARGLTLLSILPDDNSDLEFCYPDLSAFHLYERDCQHAEIL
jgi:dTDP-4-amino-4,6-dideoxygalactose transaminase